jgi:hypothetical protein
MKKEIIIDFSLPKDYEGKEWKKMEAKLESNKGNITKFRSATGGEFTHVKKGYLYEGKYPVVKFKNKMYNSTEYRYGKYNEHYGENLVTGMTGILKKFKIRRLKK